MIYSLFFLILFFFVIGWMILLIVRSPLLSKPLGKSFGRASDPVNPKPLREYHWIGTSQLTIILLIGFGILFGIIFVLIRVPPLVWYPEARTMDADYTGFEGYEIGITTAKISYVVTRDISGIDAIKSASFATAELARSIQEASNEGLGKIQVFELSVRLQRPKVEEKGYDRLGNLVRPTLIDLKLNMDDLRAANLDRLNDEDLIALGQVSFVHPSLLSACDSDEKVRILDIFCASIPQRETLPAIEEE